MKKRKNEYNLKIKKSKKNVFSKKIEIIIVIFSFLLLGLVLYYGHEMNSGSEYKKDFGDFGQNARKSIEEKYSMKEKHKRPASIQDDPSSVSENDREKYH